MSRKTSVVVPAADVTVPTKIVRSRKTSAVTDVTAPTKPTPAQTPSDSDHGVLDAKVFAKNEEQLQALVESDLKKLFISLDVYGVGYLSPLGM